MTLRLLEDGATRHLEDDTTPRMLESLQTSGVSSLNLTIAPTVNGGVIHSGLSSLDLAFTSTVVSGAIQFGSSSSAFTMASTITGDVIQNGSSSLGISFDSTVTGGIVQAAGGTRFLEDGSARYLEDGATPRILEDVGDINGTSSLGLTVVTTATGGVIRTGTSSLTLAFDTTAVGIGVAAGTVVGFVNHNIAFVTTAVGTGESVVVHAGTGSLAITLSAVIAGHRRVSGSLLLALIFRMRARLASAFTGRSRHGRSHQRRSGI